MKRQQCEAEKIELGLSVQKALEEQLSNAMQQARTMVKEGRDLAQADVQRAHGQVEG